METKTFTTILENHSVTVSALLCTETLKINVKVTDSANEHFGQTFMTEITEKQRNENLNDYFDNLQELFEFMQKEKLIKIDLEKKTITLLERTQFKKQIPFFTSELTEEEKQIEENEQQHLQQIFNRCLGKSEIENYEIKKYFEIIANELITLRKKQVYKKEQKEMENEFLIPKELPFKIRSQISQIKFESYISPTYKVPNQSDQFFQRMKEELQQRSSEKFTEFTDKICELQKLISQQNEKIETLEIKINEKSQKISEKIQKLSLLENNLSQTSKIKNTEQRLMNSESQMKHLDDILKKKYKKNKNYKNRSEQNQCKNAKTKQIQMISISMEKHSQKFFASQDNNYFAFFEQIVFDVQFTFNVKIIQMNNLIFIGVIDYEDFSNNYQSQNNYVSYYSNANKFPKYKKQGNGFKINDSVTVTVNRNTKTIKYYVNNKLQTTDNAQFLGHYDRIIFPCVSLLRNGDKIEFTF